MKELIFKHGASRRDMFKTFAAAGAGAMLAKNLGAGTADKAAESAKKEQERA
jgi:hypothetical protein